MSKHAAYTPKHRGVVERPLVEAPKKALKKTLVLSAFAVTGTGVVVGGGLALTGGPAAVTMAEDLTNPVAAISTPTAPAASTEADTADALARRAGETVSRSESRDAVDPAKKAALGLPAGTAARAVVQTEDLGSSGDPKAIASALLGSFGWSGDQFGCLVNLWNRESGWNVHAANPSSSAYGIPQALPGSKMSSAGPNWQDDAETQIKWGLGYIRDRYGSPCGAWGHSESNGWY
ncbi:MAG: aggregation-promoting factor C-terminal-like domain-containing protein [Nocardioides sp.]